MNLKNLRDRYALPSPDDSYLQLSKSPKLLRINDAGYKYTEVRPAPTLIR
jgi:hypothetical protein